MSAGFDIRRRVSAELSHPLVTCIFLPLSLLLRRILWHLRRFLFKLYVYSYLCECI